LFIDFFTFLDIFLQTIFNFQIYVSKKWGFTKYDREEYENLKEGGKLAPDGANVKFRPDHGPLENWKKVQKELLAV